ncbi:MAG: sensor histidine kinase [Candidatus Limnocylindrales bacterium]
MRSIRFRIATQYSLALFGITGLLILVVNLALGQVLASPSVVTTTIISDPSLVALGLPPEIQIDQAITDAATLINRATLDNLHLISLIGMAALLPLSFLVGWLIAGRVLRPIDRISGVVRQIGATDLSRRIALDGPDDELRRMADTFDDMLERLERNAMAQRRFIEDASHELRNPLATTRTSLDVALADPDDSEGLRTAAEVSRRATERMARTVDELLAFVRHETLNYRADPLDVADLVAESAQEYRAVAAAKAVAIQTAAAGGLIVRADREALRRALANLVANAVRVAPAGTPLIVAAGRQRGWIWLGVRDFGPGIALDDQPLVFRRAWRDGAPAAPGAGQGLGLALVRQLAEAHGGRVTLSSARGAGASFVIWLPTWSPDAMTVEELAATPDPLWPAGLAGPSRPTSLAPAPAV